MSVPPWVKNLRAKAGHDRIMIIGVVAIVIDAQERLLLIKRADDGAWVPPGGVMEPGEHIREAAVREVREEAGVTVRLGRMVGIYSGLSHTYPNGDQTSPVLMVFRASPTDEAITSIDDEAIETGFFPLEEAKGIVAPYWVQHIEAALRETTELIID